MPQPVNHDPLATVDGSRRRWPLAPPWQPRCLGCGEPGFGAHDLCRRCRQALPWLQGACPGCALPLPTNRSPDLCGQCLQHAPPLQRVVAAFLYAPPVDRWLPRFKFHRDLAAGRLLSQLMLEACAAAPRPCALVPIPLHRARLRQRGYDQALELTRPLARALALPLRGDLLRRRRATAPQSELHASERKRNLRDAFVANSAVAMPGHVVLVDDVMTTGATLHAAAEALRRAGATRVDAWVCARVP